MFKDKDDHHGIHDHDDDNTTILKKDAIFEGKLTFEGNVVVNGQFKGEIYSSGELVVGKTGVIEGKVEIGTIVVHGEIQGDIKANSKIVINAPAVVRGDIIAPSLMIEEGAVFEGNCSMGKTVAIKEVSHQAANDSIEQDADDDIMGLSHRSVEEEAVF